VTALRVRCARADGAWLERSLRCVCPIAHGPLPAVRRIAAHRHSARYFATGRASLREFGLPVIVSPRRTVPPESRASALGPVARTELLAHRGKNARVAIWYHEISENCSVIYHLDRRGLLLFEHARCMRSTAISCALSFDINRSILSLIRVLRAPRFVLGHRFKPAVWLQDNCLDWFLSRGAIQSSILCCAARPEIEE